MNKQIINSGVILALLFIANGCVGLKAPEDTAMGIMHAQGDDVDRETTTHVFLAFPF
tara:strand:- start:57478 stop:57648 length:171 start_codon:yes stop_codon:yes gene_type:complete